MDTFSAFIVAAIVIGLFVRGYLKKQKKIEALALESEEKGKLRSDGPQSQHPHIDTNNCIGCAACTMVCPEGDVLVMLGGKAVIVNGYKCIGHSLCAEVCPVGAITMVMASPSMGGDMAYLTPQFETSINNLFIVGELGGLALIKNAINQGRDCIDNIANKIAALGSRRSVPNVLDVLIVGAGPRGNQRLSPCNREKTQLHHRRRRRNGRHRREVSPPEAGHDQPGGISDARKIQEDRAFQGRADRFLGQSFAALGFQVSQGRKGRGHQEG